MNDKMIVMRNKIFFVLYIVLVFVTISCKNKGKKYEGFTPLPVISEEKTYERVRFISSLIKDNQKDPVFYYKRAKLYLDVEKYDKALIDCQKALELDSNNSDYMTMNAQLNYYAKEYGRSYDLAMKAKEQGIEDIDLERLLAKLFLERGEYDLSIVKLEQLHKLLKKNPEIYYLKARNYLGKGDTAQAMSQFNKALEQKMNYPDVYVSMIDMYRVFGMRRTAYKYAWKATNNGIVTADVLEQIGLLYDDRMMNDSAYYWFEKSYKMNQKKVSILFKSAVFCIRLDKKKDAEERLKSLFKLEPYHEKANFVAGFFYEYKLENPQEAIRYYRKVEKVAPDNKDNIISLKRVERKLKNIELGILDPTGLAFTDSVRRRRRRHRVVNKEGTTARPDSIQ